MLGRRQVIAGTAAAALFGATAARAAMTDSRLYGLIGKMKAVPGKRPALAELLVESTAGMPGCLTYLVAEDAGDPDLLWITEVWDSEASHAASLALPAVKDAIGRARPMIAAMDAVATTRPIVADELGE